MTVLLFKDQSNPRAFEVPINWFYKFGLMILFGVTTLLISVFLSAKFGWKLKTSGALDAQLLKTEVTRLQSELAQSLKQNELLRSQSITSGTALPGAMSAPNPTLAPVGDPTSAKPRSVLFTDLPQEFHKTTSVPTIEISEPLIAWRGNTLRVKFALRYTASDHGNQTGRMIIMARGRDRLLAYPDGVINRVGQGPLLLPQQGERYSVSRIRETRADFGPLAPGQEINEVQALVFDSQNTLLLDQVLEVPQRKSVKTKSIEPPPPSVEPDFQPESAPTPTDPVSPEEP